MVAVPSYRRPSRGQAGFTVVRLLIALVVLALALFIGVRMTVATSNVATTTVFNADLDSQVHRVAERLAGELQSARLDSLQPDAVAPFGTDTITYQRAEPDGSGGIGWSALRRIELAEAASDPADGMDNDGNGLVDEREIWLAWDVGTADEFRTLITSQVAGLLGGETANALDDNGNGLVDELGLSLELRERLLLIRVSMQGVGPEGDVVTRTAETAVRVRN